MGPAPRPKCASPFSDAGPVAPWDKCRRHPPRPVFLFAALGMATSVAFGRDRVVFYENGIVSLNLPPVGKRAGDTGNENHASSDIAAVRVPFQPDFFHTAKVDNPFFWRTKTEVVETIARLGMADQIAFTRSCADVHNQTKQYPHCGRCSQCIDRRFAILASRTAGS